MRPPTLIIRVKSLLISTPFEGIAKQLRWIAEMPHRMRHPELWGLYSEERWIKRILQARLTKTSCVVDVGAHLGSFLNTAINLAPQGRHIAFEPSPTRCPLLRRKFPQATIFEIAAGEQNTDATFAEDRYLPGFSRLLTEADKHVETYTVQVRRLDEILADIGKIDLIKLDIQGAELSALKGAKSIIAKWQPLIIFECGQEYGAAEAGYDRKLLYDYLVEIGYSVSTPVDFFFSKGPMSFNEFKKCGLYPFTAMNFIASSQTAARPLEADELLPRP
jgi:FkbM family methyltransferase